ncbi:S8 family serine peptidase [Actinomadura sp. 6N118]|uniref:S8 family serine peptidase n=1 Tax=Actinomadura sp. 6N118 TaxID=3375151 RepID=UPI0037B00B99
MRSVAFAVVAALVLIVAAPPVAAAPSPSARRVKCAKPATERVQETPWAQEALAANRAWNLSRGDGIVVAVLGTGVDGRVPQLAGNVLPGRDVSTPGGGRADRDCAGTGTFAAGLVAARPLTGVAFAGVAPGATVLPVKVVKDGEKATAATLAAGIEAALAGGAKVISVAVPPVAGDARLARAVAGAVARDVLVVAPVPDGSGTPALDPDAPPEIHPAAYPGVLTVAATGRDGLAVDTGRTAVSTGGRAGRSGIRVQLAAPGQDLVSLGTRGPGQLAGSGAEFAAAYVAGTAALVRGYHGGLSATAARQRLFATASRPSSGGPDPAVGWGVVNPGDAVSAVIPGTAERGGTPPAVGLPGERLKDERAARHAVLMLMLVCGAVLVVGVSAAVIRAGRGRGWRAGDAGGRS